MSAWLKTVLAATAHDGLLGPSGPFDVIVPGSEDSPLAFTA